MGKSAGGDRARASRPGRRTHSGGRPQQRSHRRHGAAAQPHRGGARAERGYGANQKTCYAKALAAGADMVVMLHPDYQYSPRLITAMAACWLRDCMRRSARASPGRGAQRRHAAVQIPRQPRPDPGGEPAAGGELSEYHSGYRAWTRELLMRCRMERCSDDFVFDNQMLAQAVITGLRSARSPVPRTTSRRPRRSISGAARSMGSGCCARRCNSCWRSGESAARRCFSFRSAHDLRTVPRLRAADRPRCCPRCWP